MHHPAHISSVLFVSSLVTLGSCGGEPPVEPSRNSVILISIDTLRRDHVGHYGYGRDTTPNLDMLAKESLVFDRCYTTMSWTLIAHMSLLTGMYPSQHQVWSTKSALPVSIPTLQERLQEQGYTTMGFYFPGWLDPRYGYGRGFDVYEPHSDAKEAAEHMHAAMEARPRDQPFFLFVHLFDAHNAPLKRKGATIYDPPPPFDEHFLPGAKDRLKSIDAWRVWKVDGESASPEQHEAIVALYDGGIRFVDHEVGTWIQEWRADGTLDESILVITSDHGEALRQRPEGYHGHGGVMEEGLRVPLLLRLPNGRFAGGRVEEPTSHVDIVPTLLALLDLEPDPRLAGFSALEGRPSDSIIYAQRSDETTIISWPYKLLQSDGGEDDRLYNLLEDPEELAPLSCATPRGAEFEALSTELKARIDADQTSWFHPDDPNPQARMLTEQERASLDDMGYAGED